MKMCEFNTAKPCDGLCNNCFLKVSPEDRNKAYRYDHTGILPQRTPIYYGSHDFSYGYEELILARQEAED